TLMHIMNSSYIGCNIDSLSSNERITYETLPASGSFEVDTSSDDDFENELYTIGNTEGDISSNDSDSDEGDIFENGDSEDEPGDSALKEIHTEQTFTSFEVLERCLKHYSTRMGFATKIVRVEKEGDICVRKTYKCRHGGKYQPKKKLDPTENRERESACIDCGFILNAAYRKRLNLVFVNKFIEKHNHELSDSKMHQQFLPHLRKIPTNIKDEIQFYVQECHFGAHLMNKYPETQKYCNRVLYSTKECWAHAFTKRNFSANTHSTQRVESDETKYAKLQEFRNMNPTTDLSHVSNTIFKGIDDMCKKYLTPNSLALQRRQMLEYILYRSWLYTNELETNMDQ
ncbi:3323_t:CDS:2, partial [Gigaspora rosea]